MPRKGGVPENLKPFKKGYDERRNSNGANAGSQSLKSILDRLLSGKVEINDRGITIEATQKEAIALKMVADAYSNTDPNIRLKAAKSIFDYTDPIPKDVNLNFQNIEGDKELTEDQAAQILKIAGGK